MTKPDIKKQLNIAKCRLEASRTVDHELYLKTWLMSLPSIQAAEIRRLYEANS